MKYISSTLKFTSDRALTAKNYLQQVFPYWCGAVLVSCVSYFYTWLLKYSEIAFQRISQHGFAFSTAAMIFGFILAGLIPFLFFPSSAGSGIPQLYAALDLSETNESSKLNRLIGWRTIPTKILSSAALLMSGGVAGREGPTLQISGSIFYLVFQKANKYSVRNLQHFLMAGAAAGLAAAFNTPLGGLVFVIEELAKSKLNEFRSSVLQAVIISGLFTQTVVGSYLYFGYPKIKQFEIRHIPAVIIISTICSLTVWAFVFMLKRVVVFRQKINSLLSVTFVCVLSAVALSLLYHFVSRSSVGSGHSMIESILFENSAPNLFDITGRFLGLIFTYLSGAAGGIFAPTLSIGAGIGSFLNGFADMGLPLLLPLCGMTAALSALTQSPLTSFILVLEMTDRHSAIVALMISALVGYAVVKLLGQDSFYDFSAKVWIKKVSDNEGLK